MHRTLRHYEVIHKDDIEHRIVKRGIKPSNNPYNTIKEVEFKTLGKNFRLILHPHRDVLHSKFKAYTVDGDGNETIVHLGKHIVRNKIHTYNYIQTIPYAYVSLQTMIVSIRVEFLGKRILMLEPTLKMV